MAKLNYNIKTNNDGTKFIEITGVENVLKDSTEIEIPSFMLINGEKIPVKQIKSLKSNDNPLKSVVIPESIVSFGANAFPNIDTVYFRDSHLFNRWKVNDDLFKKRAIWNYAGFSGTTKDGFQYCLCQSKEDGEYICVIGYVGDKINIAFPTSINLNEKNISVKSLCTALYFKNKWIRSIFIPKCIKYIDDLAFDNLSESSPMFFCEAYKKPSGWKLLWALYGHHDYLVTEVPGGDFFLGVILYKFGNCKLKYCGEFIFDKEVVWGSIGKEITVNNIEYSLCKDDNGKDFACIIGCSSKQERIDFPSSISLNGNKIPVLAICGCINFSEDCLPKYIYIPKEIINIGYRAFGYLGVYDLTLLCEAKYKPLGWDANWNFNFIDSPVYYGAVFNYSGDLLRKSKDGYLYTVCEDVNNKKYITIIDYQGSAPEDFEPLCVPSSIKVDNEILPVKVICDNAFKEYSPLDVDIPEGIYFDDYRAFGQHDAEKSY